MHPATALFSSGRSVSSRAGISACTVSGMARPSTSPRSPSMRDELLGVERVSARSLEQQPLCVSAGMTERSSRDETRRAGLLVRQRRQPSRRRVAPSPAPARLARRRAQAERCRRRMSGTPHAPVEQVLDELEKRTIGPVEILDHEDGWTASRHRFEVPAPGGERLLAADAGHLVLADADERRKSIDDPSTIGLVREEVGDITRASREPPAGRPSRASPPRPSRSRPAPRT